MYKQKTYKLVGICILSVLVVLVAVPSVFFGGFQLSNFFRTYWTSYFTIRLLNPVAVDSVFQTGNYYFGAGAYDLNKAETYYRLALRENAGMLWGHYQLARIYFVQGELDKALTEINAELEVNPANLRSLYVRGLIYISLNNLPAAEEDFRNFVAWAPAEWGGYNDLAFVLAKEGKYAESEAVIQDAFAKVPDAKDIPWLWNSLGLAQLNRLHYTDAVASFTQALALAREVTPKQWHRAYSGNDPASIEASIEAFQSAIETNLSLAQAGSSI